MSGTVGEQRAGDERVLLKGRATDPAGSIGTATQSFECTIDVIQTCFDGTDTLVGELRHSFKLPGRWVSTVLLLTQYECGQRTSSHATRDAGNDVRKHVGAHADQQSVYQSSRSSIEN